METRKVDSMREVLQESVRVRSSEIVPKPENCHFAWEVVNKSARVLTCSNPKHKLGGAVCKIQDFINGGSILDIYIYTISNFKSLGARGTSESKIVAPTFIDAFRVRFHPIVGWVDGWGNEGFGEKGRW